MRQRVLGTLTIGQAPRPDLASVLDCHLPDVHRLDRGLLDGLTAGDVAALYRPQQGEPALVTRLLDGTVVELSRARIEEAAQRKVVLLEDEGAAAILILCTGSFTGLHGRSAWLVEPDGVIPPFVAALLGRRRLGVIVPIASQIESESGKWRCLAESPLVASVSPYADPPAALAEAGRDLASRGAEALILDCIGFTEGHRRAAAACGLPVLLSLAIVAKAVAELF